MNLLKALAMFVLSFRKRDWSLDDYPLHVRRQDTDAPDTPTWCVQIIGWWAMAGVGETRADALRDLADNLEFVRQERGVLPRPGTSMPIEFASTELIDDVDTTASRFLSEVLGFNEEVPLFISDESSLSDFAEEWSERELLTKIEEVFGVDVSDVPGGNLAAIFERIESKCPPPTATDS